MPEEYVFVMAVLWLYYAFVDIQRVWNFRTAIVADDPS